MSRTVVNLKPSNMRLPRKIKKRLVKVVGIGTVKGIISGYLNLERFPNGKGIKTTYTGKPMNKFYHANQFHPSMMLPVIKHK